MPELAELLTLLVQREGSDLHLRVGEPPILRIHGELTRTEFPPLTPEDTRALVISLMNEERLAAFAEDLELDMSYATDQARFRINVFQQQGHIGAVMRVIPISIKTLTRWAPRRSPRRSPCARAGCCWSPGQPGPANPRLWPPSSTISTRTDAPMS